MHRLNNAQLRVLIVDDNVDAAEMLVMLFAAINVNATCAFNGSEAVGTADEFLPNAVFVDLEMPGMSGYEVVAHLRKRPEFSSIAIVALTARCDSLTQTRVLSSGFSDHIVKPARLETLTQVLTRIAIPVEH